VIDTDPIQAGAQVAFDDREVRSGGKRQALAAAGVDGKDLVISRDYISHGLRQRAAERVTLELGPRSEQEIRPGSIIDRHLLAKESPLGASDFGAEVQEAMDRRVDYLIEEGLARRQGRRAIFARDLLNTFAAARSGQRGCQTLS